MTEPDASLADNPYVEHEKLAKVKEKSQAIGEFIVWLEDRGVILATWEDGRHEHVLVPKYGFQRLLAEFFGIDLDKLENEKAAMLDRQRLINEGLVE